MNRVPTAEEFRKQTESRLKFGFTFSHYIEKMMIEFAKLHCKAQAEAILENAFLTHYDVKEDWMEEFLNIWTDRFEGIIGINRNSILNAYPLKNIK